MRNATHVSNLLLNRHPNTLKRILLPSGYYMDPSVPVFVHKETSEGVLATNVVWHNILFFSPLL